MSRNHKLTVFHNDGKVLEFSILTGQVLRLKASANTIYSISLTEGVDVLPIIRAARIGKKLSLDVGADDGASLQIEIEGYYDVASVQFVAETSNGFVEYVVVEQFFVELALDAVVAVVEPEL